MHRTFNTSEEIGKLVAAERLIQGVTQEELAGLSGVSPSFIGDLEAGKPRTELNRTLQVLNALGLSLTVDVSDATAERLDQPYQGRRRVATTGRAASKAPR
ncbi:MAG: helix-turn-helix transcriptional regulator [Rhodospirillaceae bacterium]|nr:helix-turn-helix transcriptional regulator [Rhodospirillaceae bacterium]